MWQCRQSRNHVKGNLASVIVLRCFFLWPSQIYHLLLHHLWLWLCVRPLLQVHLSFTHLCTTWPSNKVSYPFVQFIELSEVNGPTRPQIGPVRWEMERELSGPPSLPQHCIEGISIRPDRLRKGYRWLMGNTTWAQHGKRYCLHSLKLSCSTWNQGRLWLLRQLRHAMPWIFRYISRNKVLQAWPWIFFCLTLEFKLVLYEQPICIYSLYMQFCI